MSLKTREVALFFALVTSAPLITAAEKKATKGEEITGSGTPILWHASPDPTSRDLLYGPGGKEHQPHGEFTFLKEDSSGSNPKYVVRDGDGVKWKVKLGAEAQPETVATRLVWAAGYFVDEDYYLPEIRVKGLPSHLERGRKLVGPDGTMHGARMERTIEGEKKVGVWTWRQNRFSGTRELNGLRALLALINDWDVKDINNAIYQKGQEQIYVVSDLGAAFGASGFAWPLEKSRGNLQEYKRAKFVRKATPAYVDFVAPARPAIVRLVYPPAFIKRLKLRWIGRRIPREDAKWIGGLLATLTPKQIRSAFQAAGYSPNEVEAFAGAVEKRITQLNEL